MITREQIIKKLVKGKTVLDLGGSTGDLNKLIIDNCYSYACIDWEGSPDYLINLNDKFNIHRKFDVIIAGELIEHLENMAPLMISIKKHMREDSIFILTTPNATSFRFLFWALLGKEPKFGGHIHYFTKDSLWQLLQHFFGEYNIRFCHYTTNNGKQGLGIKFYIECLIGDLFPRLSPTLIAVCKKE